MRRTYPRFLPTATATVVVVAVSLGATGCGQVDPTLDRAAWLSRTILADNRAYIERAPDLVAQKFAKMTTGLIPYLRGTAGQFIRDMERPGGVPASHYLTADAAAVGIAGDPHPENIGTFRAPDGSVVVEINDFDAASYGPYVLDVDRMASTFAVGCIDLNLPKQQLDPTDCAGDVAQGYADEMRRIAAGGSYHALDQSEAGVIFSDLIKKAGEKGAADDKLDEYSQVKAGARSMVFGDIDPPVNGVISNRISPVAPALAAKVRALVEGYRDTLTDPSAFPAGYFTVLDLGRRIGAGVGSFPLWRFYVLIEGPTPSPDDDVLLEVKEESDQSGLLADPAGPARYFNDNAERVVEFERGMQVTSPSDPLLGWGRIGRLSFRMRDRTAYQKGLSWARVEQKVAEGKWTPADVLELARQGGIVLARAHADAPTLSGRRGADVIAEAIGGDWKGFVAETRTTSFAYAQQIVSDYQLFQRLLQRDGPLLGFPIAQGEE